MGGQSQYMVVGRYVPNAKYTAESAQCKVYRMKLFAKNKVVARSRFWYFMGRLCRVKKANGQIISVNQMYDKNPEVVKNFGFWFRYESRTGTHNAYKECKRPIVKQFHSSKIKFPLPHRVIKTPKEFKTTCATPPTLTAHILPVFCAAFLGRTEPVARCCPQVQGIAPKHVFLE